MADGGGVGDEGSGLAEWQPIYDRVEALVSKCQAHAVSLVADRALLGAADWVQRESWEAARRLQRSVEELQAAAREKEAEMDRLQAEAAIARKKLQADAGRKMRWEAAYVDLLLGANQKLAELRDGDMDDSRTCAETPNLTGVGSCTNLNPNDADHIAIDLSGELRKLKQAYETLSSKKDKEVSALLSAKDSACNQLSIIQQNYAELLKKKEAEAAQATEATRTLQQNVDELKVLAQNKDDEIGRMRAEAIGVQNKLQKMQSLVKEKDDEIQRLKGRHPVSVQKRNKDISETHKRSRSDDPHVVVREPENNGLGQTIGDKIPETKAMENNWQDETTRKRRRASSMSNDDEKSGSNEDDAEQIESGEDGDKGSGSYVDGDEQSGNGENGDEQTGSGEDGDGDDDNEEQSGSDEETTHNQVQKPLRNTRRYSRRYYNSRKGDVMTWLWPWKAPAPLRSRKLQIINGRRFLKTTGHWGQYVKAVKDSLVDQPDKYKEFGRFLRNFENWRARDVARNMEVLLDDQPNLIRQLNRFLPNNCQIKVKEDEKQQPEVKEPHQRGVPRPRWELPLAPESASAAAGLIKLSEEEV